MFKRCWSVCIFGTITFISIIHVLEAFVALFFGKEIILLNMYPLISSFSINNLTYLVASVAVTTILIAITSKLAFTSPLENYLNMILSDANMTNQAENEIIPDHRSTLDMICETITDISTVLGQTKDVTYNVRSELIALRPLPERTKKLTEEINELKKEIVKIKKNFKKPNTCPSCGNTILSRFKICPYCGEALQLKPENIIIKNIK